MMVEARVFGELYFSNKEGRGVFTRRRDGTWHQHIGTCQTPRFDSGRQLGAWVRRNFDLSEERAAFRRKRRQPS